MDANGEVAIAQHRLALSRCEVRRSAAIAHLDEVRRGFGLTRQ